jgi:hypothetical protein
MLLTKWAITPSPSASKATALPMTTPSTASSRCAISSTSCSSMASPARPARRCHRLPRARPHATHRRCCKHAQRSHPHPQSRCCANCAMTTSSKPKSSSSPTSKNCKAAAPQRPRQVRERQAADSSSSPDPIATSTWYNRELSAKGEGLLPAAIKGQARAEAAGPRPLLMQRLTHPSVLYFNDARGGRLQDAEFRHWFELTANNEAAPNASSISTATSRCSSKRNTARAASSPPPPPPMPNGATCRSSPSSCRSCSASPPTSPRKAVLPPGSSSAPPLRREPRKSRTRLRIHPA